MIKVAWAGCWVLGTGYWVLGAGCLVLGTGCWVLGTGCWVLDRFPQGMLSPRQSQSKSYLCP